MQFTCQRASTLAHPGFCAYPIESIAVDEAISRAKKYPAARSGGLAAAICHPPGDKFCHCRNLSFRGAVGDEESRTCHNLQSEIPRSARNDIARERFSAAC